MENRFVKAIAGKLADAINRHYKKEDLEFTKMALGIEIFLINVSKLIITYSLAVILDVWVQTLAIHGAFMLIKRYML